MVTPTGPLAGVKETGKYQNPFQFLVNTHLSKCALRIYCGYKMVFSTKETQPLPFTCNKHFFTYNNLCNEKDLEVSAENHLLMGNAVFSNRILETTVLGNDTESLFFLQIIVVFKIPLAMKYDKHKMAIALCSEIHTG